MGRGGRTGPLDALGAVVSAAVGAAEAALRPVPPVAGLADQLEAVRILNDAGLLRPSRPDRLAASLLTVLRYGFTPASAVAISALRYPDETAIVDDSGSVTFAELDSRSDALAAALAGTGVAAGDRIGILCRNHRGFVEALAAGSKLGADVLLLNTAMAGPQLAEVVRREHARLIVHDGEFGSALNGAGVWRRRVVAWPEGGTGRTATLDELVDAHRGERVPPPERVGRIVVLTSGTTGAPRGATRGGATGIDPVVAILSRIPLRVREKTLIAPPLFHAWGLAHLMLGSLLSSTLVLQRQFEPRALMTAAAQHEVTAVVAVPIMLRRLLELPHDDLRSHRLDALRVIAVSGSALPASLAEQTLDVFGDVLYNLYGSTEVAWAAIATPRDMREAPGSVGTPPRGTVVRILDNGGATLPPGTTGRIFVGNAMVFEGYTGGGDKPRVGGLVDTGDIGRLDDAGRLYVEARSDDMIVSGGENVFPGEVEETLEGLPGVADLAVVGVSDEEWGQRLAAYIVRSPGATLDADAVRAHVRSRLARYKVPRDVVFVEEIPRNPAGKVVRRELPEPSPTGHAGVSADGGHGRAAPARPARAAATAPRSTRRSR